MKNTFLEEETTKRALADFVLRAKKLSMGEKCEEFEQKFAQFQGRAQAVLFNSGGSANLALMQSLRNMDLLKAHDSIGFSALTWSTNVMPLIQMDLVPVPIDCCVETLNSHAQNVEATLRSHSLTAIFVTNALGLLGDLDKVNELCRTRGIILLEDNCESLGSELPAGKAGNFGLASTFSFFVAHHMSTVEGGMVCTDDDRLAEMLRIVRANGWDRNLAASSQDRLRRQNNIEDEFEAKYSFYDLGYNLRPTEITGFLGTNQLQYIEQNIDKRESNFLVLERSIRANPDLVPPEHGHMKRVSSFAFPVICKSRELRNKYFHRFRSADVEIRPVIAGNIQKQPFYKKYVKDVAKLVNVDLVHDNGFYFGNYPELATHDLHLLTDCLQPS